MNIRFISAIVILSSPFLSAQEYQGASAVLKRLAEKPLATPEKKADPVEELRLKIKTLRQASATQPPEEAASQWLALLDAYFTIPADQLYSQRAYEDQLSLNQIIASLPPPDAWDEVAGLLTKRKTSIPLQDEGLRLLAAVLNNDAASRQQRLGALAKAIKDDKQLEEYQREQYQQLLDQLAETLDSLTGSDAANVATFEKRLARLEKGDEKARERFGNSLEVPDLVRFAGENKAAELLRRTLQLDIESLIIEGKATRELAASLALKHINDLKKPHWELVHTLTHAPLYEALKKRFPEEKQPYTMESATRVYLLALIAEDRTQEAVKLATESAGAAKPGDHLQIDTDDLEEMGRSGLGAKVHAFLKGMLTTDPAMPYWREFIELSARQDAASEALDLLRTGLAKKNLSASTTAEMQSHYYLALLAADQREEGLKVLRELVKSGPRSGGTDTTARAQEMRQRWEQVGVHITPEILKRFEAQAGRGQDGGELDFITLTRKLAALGRLLERQEIVDEAIAASIKAAQAIPSENSNREQAVHSLVRLLLDHNKGPQAEMILAEHLAQLTNPDQKQRRRVRLDESLALLMLVYQKAGRPADALAVLEQSPDWGSPDLAAFEATNLEDTPLLLLAAQVLFDSDRKEDARRVIRRAVQDYPAKDAVYALLLKLGAAQPLEPLLDELAQRDRFEERPLIWKARLQLDAGRVDEAHQTVRAAITIDPSDGEQGKGDRMRAYAILAEVLEKKGDQANAKIMRGAVSAIRKSEEADDWWNAGLLSEAVRRYEAALLDFADAYCIQSRLALRYSELGQHDKAEQHYMRAFELMPDSFGRVESHCFGCERAFNGKRAQNTAEKVFARLAANPPVKPQVHYLLGYLRDAQGRPAEALEAYRAAVKADPDYLNAWQKLASLADTTQMSREESEQAALQMFRLDPAGHHSNPNVESVRDLKQLWTALLAAERNLPATETGSLLTLTASKSRITSQQAASGSSDAWNSWSYPSLFSRQHDTRQHLLQNQLMQTVANFIDSVSRR